MWNADSNDLETVLGGDLGIEISNITGNGVPLKVASVSEKKNDKFVLGVLIFKSSWLFYRAMINPILHWLLLFQVNPFLT